MKEENNEAVTEPKNFSLMFHIQADVNGSLLLDTIDSMVDSITALIKVKVLEQTKSKAEIRYANCEVLGIGGENV